MCLNIYFQRRSLLRYHLLFSAVSPDLARWCRRVEVTSDWQMVKHDPADGRWLTKRLISIKLGWLHALRVGPRGVHFHSWYVILLHYWFILFLTLYDASFTYWRMVTFMLMSHLIWTRVHSTCYISQGIITTLFKTDSSFRCRSVPNASKHLCTNN